MVTQIQVYRCTYKGSNKWWACGQSGRFTATAWGGWGNAGTLSSVKDNYGEYAARDEIIAKRGEKFRKGYRELTNEEADMWFVKRAIKMLDRRLFAQQNTTRSASGITAVLNDLTKGTTKSITEQPNEPVVYFSKYAVVTASDILAYKNILATGGIPLGKGDAPEPKKAPKPDGKLVLKHLPRDPS